MEATSKRPPITGKLLNTRGGTLLLAGGVALLAAIVLIAFLHSYKKDVQGGAVPVSALVANALIPKGTSGDVVIGESLFKPTTVAESSLKGDALSDASSIAGKVAVRDVYPGQQLTAADFAGKGDPLRGKLNGGQRAASIPVDVARGLIGTIRTGDHVDVIGAFSGQSGGKAASAPLVRTLMQNVLVLKAPTDITTNSPTTAAALTLRVTEKQAAALAYTVDNGKIYIALRPPAGASQSAPVSLDLNALIAGSSAVSGGK